MGDIAVAPGGNFVVFKRGDDLVPSDKLVPGDSPFIHEEEKNG